MDVVRKPTRAPRSDASMIGQARDPSSGSTLLACSARPTARSRRATSGRYASVAAGSKFCSNSGKVSP